MFLHWISQGWKGLVFSFYSICLNLGYAVQTTSHVVLTKGCNTPSPLHRRQQLSVGLVWFSDNSLWAPMLIARAVVIMYWSTWVGCDIPAAQDPLRPASSHFSCVSIPFPVPLQGTFSSFSYPSPTSWGSILTSQVFSLHSPQLNWAHVFHRLMESHHMCLCMYHTLQSQFSQEM